MNKLFVFLLVAVSLVVMVSSNSTAVAVQNQPAFLTPTPTPQPAAEIERIETDKNEVIIPFPQEWKKRYSSGAFAKCFSDDESWGLITIETIVRNPQSVSLVYGYTVSGGRIIGQGKKVVWDLKGVRPGVYTIEAAIDYGLGFVDKPKSANITVRDNSCHLPCFCPTLDVSGGGIIKAGETMAFEANVSGVETIDITYKWTVSKGEIIKGQGTPKITVKTSSGMNGEIKATVEIGGSDLCAECPRTASETGGIEK